MCPSLVAYNKGFQMAAADALPKSSSEIQQMISDYAKLRAACKSLN